MGNLQNGKSIFQISLNITIGGSIWKIYDGRTNERIFGHLASGIEYYSK